MRLPNKLFTYRESVISKFPIIVKLLKEKTVGVLELYRVCQKNNIFSGIIEFMQTLDCLYVLGCVDYNEKEKVLYYVETVRL